MTRSMRNRRVSTSIAAICALALVPLAPLRAAPDEESDEPSKSEKLLEQVTALTTAIEGVRSKAGDTVAEKGGELEGALLSSFAIKAAAAKIRSQNTGTAYLVASSSDAVSTDRWLLFDAQLQGICFRLTGNLTCSEDTAIQFTNTGRVGGGPLAAVAAFLPFLSSVFRSETEVSALGGALKDSKLLARAIAADTPDTSASKPNAFRLLAPTRLDGIDKKQPYLNLQKLIAARTRIAKANSSPRRAKPDEAVAASIKAADELIAATLTADAAGNVPFLDIIRGYDMQAKLGAAQLLTVTIDYAGGTMLKRKGIDVALGAPSVRASGGVIVSYTVESGGEIIKSGFVACTTRLTELKRVHQLKAEKFKNQCS